MLAYVYVYVEVVILIDYSVSWLQELIKFVVEVDNITFHFDDYRYVYYYGTDIRSMSLNSILVLSESSTDWSTKAVINL
ncbi:hypothetical protein DSUL_20001 [Desulfovibrionales bacterium]